MARLCQESVVRAPCASPCVCSWGPHADPSALPCPTDSVTAFTRSRDWANHHRSVKKLFFIKTQYFFTKPSGLRLCLCSRVSLSSSTEGRALVPSQLQSPQLWHKSPRCSGPLLHKLLPGTICLRLSPAPALSSSFLQLLKLGWWQLLGTQRSWCIPCFSCCMASAVI